MTETTFSRALQQYIRQRGGVVVKFHGSALTASGVPDLWGSFNGRPFAVELKTSDGTTSKLQRAMLRSLARGGYITGVVTSVKAFERLFAD